MNVGDEHSISCWMKELPRLAATPLQADTICDVVVVGSGIAGLSIAYELTREGRSVVVIDRGKIGAGMTARTTAHLASALDDYYSELIAIHGEDKARLYHSSQVAAIDRIEAICDREHIGADFARVDGYLFAARPDDLGDLETEHDACSALGIDVAWVERAPIGAVDTGKALRFSRQARIHPTRYLTGLAHAVITGGGTLYRDTAYVADRETDDGIEIETEAGPLIRAKAVAFATNSPVNNRVTVHTKQTPMRSYVIAGRVPAGSVADVLLWDSLEAYHYVRIQPLDAVHDLLIAGGEDHRTGEASDMEARFAALVEWTREHFPEFGEPDYRWSGQVLEPLDYMPYCGRNPGSRNIFIHSGDSGQGMTNGVAAALTLVPLLLDAPSRFADLFDPGRKPLTSSAPLADFVKGQADVARNMAEYVTRGEVAAEDEIEAGAGAIIRQGLHKRAVYRDPQGAFVRRSASCTHAGCIVHWNPFEHCWDCPCHGSQFAPDGAVLNGPAIHPLASVDEAS